MNDLSPQALSDANCVRARLHLIKLHLSLAVARARALRRDGSSERFAGVLMRDEDIAALCRDWIDPQIGGLEGVQMALAEAEASYSAQLRAAPALPRLERLFAVFGLSKSEQDIFMLAFATAVDARVGRVVGFLNEDMARQEVCFGTLERVFGGAVAQPELWRAVTEDQTLCRYGLLRRAVGAAPALAGLSVPFGIVDLLTGGVAAKWVPHCLNGVVPQDSDAPCLVQAASAMDVASTWDAKGRTWLIDGTATDLEGALTLLTLAAIHGDHALLWDWDAADEQTQRILARALGRHATLITQRPAIWDRFDGAFARTHKAPSTHGARLVFWGRLGLAGLAPLLAAEPSIELARLYQLASQSNAGDHLGAQLRQHRSEPMQGLADLIPSRFTFDDLELPERTKSALKRFAARRGSDATVLEDWGLGATLGARAGGVALFTGPSGVGKTMSATVVAGAAGLDLWRINLATVVSKYIGETQANLERIFKAADAADVVLFFDEADALFSKRAEVTDARDRYANMEMAYLLQRIEDFSGMAILASNMGAALDPAMLRRFDLVLEFTIPDAATRARLWARLENGKVPLADDVDLAVLAERFELAGGHIKQAILSAAHMAAGAGQPVDQAMLMHAVAAEIVKLSKPLRKDDFGDHFATVRHMS